MVIFSPLETSYRRREDPELGRSIFPKTGEATADTGWSTDQFTVSEDKERDPSDPVMATLLMF
jgi:hypothetical protein